MPSPSDAHVLALREISRRFGRHPGWTGLIANLVAEHGREGFLAAWLRARDAGWAVDLIPSLTNKEKSS